MEGWFLCMYNQSGTAGSHGSSICNFFEICHTGFHSSCTILNYCQKHSRALSYPHSHQHLLFAIKVVTTLNIKTSWLNLIFISSMQLTKKTWFTEYINT